MSVDHVLDELQERGLLEQISNADAIRDFCAARSGSAYAGFDPTADSLHVGHLVPVMILAHLQRAGVRPIAVVGGATGMIGDPSGKDDERKLLGSDAVQANCDAIGRQLTRFLSFEGEAAAELVNNADWIGKFSYIDWLREVGKYFTVNYMMGKESVRRRLESRDQGISYTEFSYMMLQAYDFLHLFETRNCRIQVGGNDQWGNITAGIDLVHKRRGESVMGMTCPLMTTSSGEKFGKSAGNAVWLDPARTSPYEFYQYWMKTEDRDVERWLKAFSFLPVSDIVAIAAAHMEAPERREGQKRLAAEMTLLVHGLAGLESAERATHVLFGGSVAGLTDDQLLEIFADVPKSVLSRQLLADGTDIVSLLVTAGAAASKGEARRLVTGGGVYLNNERVTSVELAVGTEQLASESVLLLRLGRSNYRVVRFEGVQ
jgi:tyrosyl-tRNA synthetase